MKLPGIFAAVLWVLSACALLGCNEQPRTIGPGSGPGSGNGNGSGNGTPSDIDPKGKTPGQCAKRSFPIGPARVPEAILVVDRSGSMDRTIGSTSTTKWSAMRNALQVTVNARASTINFGIAIYPRTTGCSAGNMSVAPSRNNATAIKSALTPNPLIGARTPTAQTLEAVGKQLAAVSSSAPRYVLLATDGTPWCDTPSERASETDAKVVAAVTALAAQKVKTLVIGFGSDVINARPRLLNDIAVAGGMAQTTGKHKFYAATDSATLNKAVADIAGRISTASCTYSLGTLPKNATATQVKLDGKPIPRAAPGGNGWYISTDGKSVIFAGAWCKQLLDGKIRKVEAEFTCAKKID